MYMSVKAIARELGNKCLLLFYKKGCLLEPLVITDPAKYISKLKSPHISHFAHHSYNLLNCPY